MQLRLTPRLPRGGTLQNIIFCWIAWLGVVLTGNFGALAGQIGPRAAYPLQDAPARLAPLHIADGGAPDGVRLITSSPSPLLKQGDSITNTLEVSNATAGQRIRLQSSNHGANYFTTTFSAAVQTAVANIPGVICVKVTEQQMEVVLAPGSYRIPIAQTVTEQDIPGSIDDASWAPGTQLQVDWLLSSAPSNGALVEINHTVVSKWITYGHASVAPSVTYQGAPSDARWALLRSLPNIGAAGTVTFEIHETNYALTSSTTLKLAVDGASTASDADFTQSLDAAVHAALVQGALGVDSSYDARTGTLTFGPKTVFPVTFSMTAGPVGAHKDYILDISGNQFGQIDVAKAGVRLGTLSMQPMKPLLGVNEASGEFGVGAPYFKYAYPGQDRLDWGLAQGFEIFRIPFLFQNIQPNSGAALNEAAMRQLDPVLGACAAKHIVCLLDMHNYGSY